MKINKKMTSTFILLGIGFLGGLLIGMVVQQAIIQATLMKVAGNLDGVLDGVEIEINFNETKLVEATRDTIVPPIQDIFNESAINDFKGCKPVPCECAKLGCALYCMECEEGKK